MREGWQIRKLGDVCSVRRDSSIHTGMNYVGLEHISSGNGVLVSLADTSGVIGTTNLFNAGDVLYGKLRPYLKKVIVADCDGCCSTEILPIRCNGDILPDFLKYWFLEDGITDKINATCGGCRMPRANMKDVFQFAFAFPSLPEQQRIVDILDREFAKIDALKANTEKSLQAAKDLFQATTDTMMSNGQWRELTIGEIAKIKGGKRVPKGYKLEKEPTAHRYIRVADFTDLGTIRTESVLYISDEVYKSIKAYTISSKDVYISIAGTIGKSGIIPDTLDGANLTENACKLVLGPNFYNRFVFFATKTSSFKKQVETLTMQAAQPKLALTRLATIRVRVPSSIKEQETIVERLDGIADTIALLQENYQKALTLCDDLKQSLLRKAFNGEL